MKLNQQVPPQNIVAEESIIVSILIDPKLFDQVTPIISSEDFYKTSNKVIFQAMESLKVSRKNIDIVEMVSLLADIGDLEVAGGAAYIAGLTMDVPLSLNVKGHALLIQNASMGRKTIEAAHEILAKCYQPGTDDPLSFAQSKMMGIQHKAKSSDIIDFRSLLDKRLADIETNTTTEQDRGFSLGFPTFDRIINFTGSKLVVLAARPSHGKTAMMLTWARNLAKGLVRSGILSLEMDKEQLIDRAISSETGIDTMKFTQYMGLTKKHWDSMYGQQQTMGEWPIMIDDEGPNTIDDVERKCRMMKQAGCEVLFIDQLSKIKPRRGQSPTESYSEHTNRLAELKKELRIPIVLLAQLNRDVEKRADREPMLSDLKQTGSLEEDADLIFFIMRPEVYSQDPKFKGQVILNLAKNRQGRIAREANSVRFEGPTTTFYEDMGLKQNDY